MNIFKFFISLVMTIVMLLLMDPRSFYGLVFHEWAGLIIGLLFILHKILDWSWIKKVTIKFFSKTSGRARLNYFLDVILLIGIILMILSGQKIYLKNVLWFLAVFASFTVLTVYIDRAYIKLWKKRFK